LLQGERPGRVRCIRLGKIIRCPWHGWEFDIRTGQSWCEPDRVRTRTFPVSCAMRKNPGVLSAQRWPRQWIKPRVRKTVVIYRDRRVLTFSVNLHGIGIEVWSRFVVDPRRKADIMITETWDHYRGWAKRARTVCHDNGGAPK
jgi:hypothetical protein